MASYNDPAKQKSREKLRDFIAKHILSRKAAAEVTVACLPGAESVREAGLEVREVYLPLGIKPENIIGIEADPEVYARLVEADLGITLTGKPEFDIDFFKRTNKRFDVVSLDYKGMQTNERLLATHKLAQRRILADNAVLCTVYAANREPKSLQIAYAMHTLFEMDAVDPAVVARIKQGNFTSAVDYVGSNMRDGIILRTINTLNFGQFPLLSENIEDEVSDTPPHIMQILAIALNNGATTDNVTTPEMNRLPRNGLTIEEIPLQNSLEAHTLVGNMIAATLYSNKEMQKMRGYMRSTLKEVSAQEIEKGYREIVRALTETTMNFLGNPYRVNAIERYRYRSNKHTNMDVDLLAVDNTASRNVRLRSIIAFENGVLVCNPYQFDVKTFTKVVMNATDSQLRLQAEIPEQVHLGSSAVRKSRISVADIADLRQSGVAIDEIAETYTLPKTITREQGLTLRDAGVTPSEFKQYFGLPPMRVAGWAAHESRKRKTNR